MNTSIFLSYPKPINDLQVNFIEGFESFLIKNRLIPRTLGVSDYDTEAPLTAIRRLINESNGLITIAFKRTLIEKGKFKPDSDSESVINNKWITSPFCHIEPAMAYQVGLPVLILREEGVIDDGILEKGVLGLYMPSFDLSKQKSINYFEQEEWNQIFQKWHHQVCSVVETKGNPPKLF